MLLVFLLEGFLRCKQNTDFCALLLVFVCCCFFCVCFFCTKNKPKYENATLKITDVDVFGEVKLA